MSRLDDLKAHAAEFRDQANALEANLSKQPDDKSRATLQSKIDGIRDGVDRTEAEIEMLDAEPVIDPAAEAVQTVKDSMLVAAHQDVAREQVTAVVEGKSPQEVIDLLSPPSSS